MKKIFDFLNFISLIILLVPFFAAIILIALCKKLVAAPLTIGKRCYKRARILSPPTTLGTRDYSKEIFWSKNRPN